MSNEFRYLFPIIVITWFSSFIIAYQIFEKTKNSIFLKKLFLPLLIFLFFFTALTNKKIPNKNTILDKVDQKKLLFLEPKEKVLVSNFIKNYDENEGKVLTNIYSLNDLAFAKLKDLKIVYSERLIYNKNKNFSFIVAKGECTNFEKYNFNKIYFDKNIGCILFLGD